MLVSKKKLISRRVICFGVTVSVWGLEKLMLAVKTNLPPGLTVRVGLLGLLILWRLNTSPSPDESNSWVMLVLDGSFSSILTELVPPTAPSCSELGSSFGLSSSGMVICRGKWTWILYTCTNHCAKNAQSYSRPRPSGSTVQWSLNNWNSRPRLVTQVSRCTAHCGTWWSLETGGKSKAGPSLLEMLLCYK